MSNHLAYLLTFAAYAVLAFIFIRRQLSGQTPEMRGLSCNLVLVPIVLHGYLLYMTLWVSGGLYLGFDTAISLILWLTMLVYWLAHFFYPLATIKAIVLPIAGMGSILPWLMPVTQKSIAPTSLVFDAHVLAAMLAYSLFTIAALHAGLMSMVEKNLHRAKMSSLMRNLPPLLTMEKLLFRMIAAGFILLTVTLVSGSVFSEQIFGRPFQFNHKVLLGLVSWMVFGVLLAGHYLRGWRGKTAVSWTMWGFGFLLLAYLGSQFVLRVILHR